MRKFKTISLLLAIVMTVVLCFSACGGNADTDTTTAAPTEKTTIYKDTMIPFEDIVSGERIVFLQSVLNYTREGFFTEDTKPATEDITYGGTTVAAFALTDVIDFFIHELEGDVKVTDTEGTSVDVKADDFAGMYAIIGEDFTTSDAPTLYNPTTKTEIKNFAYAVTAEGEAIYSIPADSAHNCADIIKNCGWDTTATYRYVATDKFYAPVGEVENKTGELRGALSGEINGSWPDLKIISGKMNNVAYLEVIVEQ